MSLDTAAHQGSQISPRNDAWQLLTEQVHRLEAHLIENNIRQSNIPASPDTQEAFQSKPEEIRLMISGYLKTYCDLLEKLLRAGTRLMDNRQATWACLSLMNLRCKPDAFDKVAEDDVIEFYSADHRQIYRNIRFFSLCSYSIFDILVYDWATLYSRDVSITESLMTHANAVIDGSIGTGMLEVGHHYLQELRGEKRKALIKPGMISPLWDRSSSSSRPSAYLTTLKAQLIEASKT
jgi:hypothetical protein